MYDWNGVCRNTFPHPIGFALPAQNHSALKRCTGTVMRQGQRRR